MSDTGNMLTAIAALIAAKQGSMIADGVDKTLLRDWGLLNETGGLTLKGEAWLAMILATPLPVQQWIDPRASNGQVYDWKRVDASNLGDFRGANFGVVEGKVIVAEPDLPKLPDGFTAWGGELGTRFDPELKADVAVTVPNGIGVDAIVVVFQRNGKVRDVKGQQRFPAGSINWNWAKPLPAERIPAGQEAKAAERFKRQQAEDVIGYAIIPGEDDHLRRDLR